MSHIPQFGNSASPAGGFECGVESGSENFGYDELLLEVKFNCNMIIMKIPTKIL
jgi:hypothetical protein